MMLMLAVLLQVIVGVGVPQQSNDTLAFDVPVAWHDWASDGCAHPQFWPSIWRPRVGLALPDECAGRPLLIGNECSYDQQCNAPARDVAETLHEWAGSGYQLYCCGEQYDDGGWVYTWQVLGWYWALYGEPPPLTGLHIHLFTYGQYDLRFDNARRWRTLADLFGWDVVVSEYACLGTAHQTVASCMEPLTQQIDETMQPSHVFWFSWRYEEFSPQTNVVTVNGQYTDVGKVWARLAGLTAGQSAGRRVWLPGLQ